MIPSRARIHRALFLLPLCLGANAGLAQSLIPRADLHGYVIEIRRHILRQVVDGDAVDSGRGVARAQYGFPLDESRSRNADGRIFL